MASRKKPPSSLSLFAAPVAPVAPVAREPIAIVTPIIPEPREAPPPDESSARPRLRLVTKPDEPEEDIVVEKHDDGTFSVSVIRHFGTTMATVIYTRAQLEMMIRRAEGALKL